MSLKRSLMAMLLMLGLMAGSIATAVAGAPAPAAGTLAAALQDDDATPEADDDETGTRPEDDDEAAAGDDAAEGDVVDNVTVEVLDERGDPWFAITVNETIDDWDDYSEFSTPDRGFRYVALVVTVENLSEDTAEVTDFDFFVRDEQGFIYGTSFASIEEESESAEIGEFESTDVAAGESYTGIMIFGVPNDAQIVDAFFAPTGRLITVATLGGEVLTED
jgi:lipopolysaccharide export LptBFGC system permease protein LptF